MADDRDGGGRREGDRHIETEMEDKYRQAAEDALSQLDWCIGYLHGIRKVEVSRALARNRSFIRKSLLGEAEEPLPTQSTTET